MKFDRSSGILLHPTSLPGTYGIGDIGPQAHGWIDFLAEAGCGLWQILPLGPTGYGDSPYQCFSAFAGNPYLISLEALLRMDLLHPDDLFDRPRFPNDRVDFGQVIPWKLNVLDRSFNRFQHLGSPKIKAELAEFARQEAGWLDDFALFMAIKEAHGGAPWTTWEAPLRRREPKALAAARQKYEVATQRQVYRQFIFFRQWAKLRQHAHDKGIRIIGDIPIFVAHDSADVWANPSLFFLEENGMPSVVAGVPPDYFSPTGQLWGNPLYDWKAHASTGYAWWLARIRAVLSTVDIIRVDHFRGFAGYWEVPGDAKTAETGSWVPGPGKDFFNSISQGLGDLPIIAEDLGVITPDVDELRIAFNLPGMKVIQFSAGAPPTDQFWPHNFPLHSVVYTGTHDNDTLKGWYDRLTKTEQLYLCEYLNQDGRDIVWDTIRACWSSAAVFSVAPMQDFLELDNQARMNYPGRPSGNWMWRMPADAMSKSLARRIHRLSYLFGRLDASAYPAPTPM